MALRLNDQLGSSAAASAAVPRVLTGKAFIAVLVVARDSGHELLGICVRAGLDFRQELLCVVAPQGGCKPSAMEDLYVAPLPGSVREAEVMLLRFRFFHAGFPSYPWRLREKGSASCLEGKRSARVPTIVAADFSFRTGVCMSAA